MKKNMSEDEKFKTQPVNIKAGSISYRLLCLVAGLFFWAIYGALEFLPSTSAVVKDSEAIFKFALMCLGSLCLGLYLSIALFGVKFDDKDI